jgi:hypothetical protein
MKRAPRVRWYKSRKCRLCQLPVRWWQRQYDFETFGSAYQIDYWHELCSHLRTFRTNRICGSRFPIPDWALAKITAPDFRITTWWGTLGPYDD